MKRLLFASLVAVAATTLQAVDYDWTNVNTNGNATGQVTLENGLSRTQGFAVSLTINVTQVPASMNNSNWWPTLLSLGRSEDSLANITANMTQADGIRLDTKSGGPDNTQTCVASNKALTVGNHTIVLAYDGENMTLTLDGTVIAIASADYTLTYDPNLVAWGQQAGYPDGTYLNANGQFQYTIESLRVGRVETIPEPTALALLALGVAGVTLRRRVA